MDAITSGVHPLNGNNPVALYLEAVHLDAKMNLAPGVPYTVGHMLPQLPRAQLGIEKLLNQRGLGLLLANISNATGAQRPFENMRHSAFQREPLDALGSPLRADLVAGHAPNLLRVRLEEREVELAAEAVDEKVLQRLFLEYGKQGGAHVADAAANGSGDSHLFERGGCEPDGVVEEAPEKIDAALAWPHQHH